MRGCWDREDDGVIVRRFLLKARLYEIVDRWTDGPLSAEMTAAEVKHVIRALFENNDRRAATLNAIR